MNTIFLTVPASKTAKTTVNLGDLKKKSQAFLGDERVKNTLTVISLVAPLVAGPMATASGRILPTVAKGLKIAPQAINCVTTLVQP